VEEREDGLIEGTILELTGPDLKSKKNLTHNRQHLNAHSNLATRARKSQALPS
jgi:hypothetical protein